MLSAFFLIFGIQNGNLIRRILSPAVMFQFNSMYSIRIRIASSSWIQHFHLSDLYLEYLTQFIAQLAMVKNKLKCVARRQSKVQLVQEHETLLSQYLPFNAGFHISCEYIRIPQEIKSYDKYRIFSRSCMLTFNVLIFPSW